MASDQGERYRGQVERARAAGLNPTTIESVRQGCYSDSALEELIGKQSPSEQTYSRAGTVKRTGHWIAHHDRVYLRRRSSQPILVWDVRTDASSFRTKREAMEAVRLSGSRRTDVVYENVAQTHAGFLAWRREG